MQRHGHLAETFERATDGNIALTAEIDATTPALLAIGFGRTPDAAAFQAAASLARGHHRAEAEYVVNWRNWQNTLQPLDPPPAAAAA